MRFEEYQSRTRPVGVLYVDVHPFAWNCSEGPQFLLLRRRDDVPLPGQWQTVSGKLHPDERITDAFHRQVLEKTGIAPLSLYKLSRVATFFDEYYDTVMLVPNALALVTPGDVTLDESLHDEYRWVDGPSALELLRWPTQREAVSLVQSSFTFRSGELLLEPDQFDVAIV